MQCVRYRLTAVMPGGLLPHLVTSRVRIGQVKNIYRQYGRSLERKTAVIKGQLEGAYYFVIYHSTVQGPCNCLLTADVVGKVEKIIPTFRRA